MSEVRWAVRWENAIPPEEHEALATLLAAVYPAHRDMFDKRRTWSGARPEGRVVGFHGDRPIAHLGFVRRFLRLPDDGTSVLVGDVGLVGVDPELQGGGIGRALLAETARAFARLGLPYGYLTCREEVIQFYARGGWQQVTGGTRMINWDEETETYHGPAMVLPVQANLRDWPHGRLVDRNGAEV